MDRRMNLNGGAADIFHKTLSAVSTKKMDPFRSSAGIELPARDRQSPISCFDQTDPDPIQPGGLAGGRGGQLGLPTGSLCVKYGESANRTSAAESSGGEQSPDDDSDGRCDMVLLADGRTMAGGESRRR
ncbi:class E basic helix-loop-helix protein 22 [Lates japonicus]